MSTASQLIMYPFIHHHETIRLSDSHRSWLHCRKAARGTVSRLAWYWLSKRTEGEGQATECLHWDSHLLKAVLLPLGQNARKAPKSRHLEVVVLLGLELNSNSHEDVFESVIWP